MDETKRRLLVQSLSNLVNKARENLSAWGKVAKSPELRQQYHRDVIQRPTQRAMARPIGRTGQNVTRTLQSISRPSQTRVGRAITQTAPTVGRDFGQMFKTYVPKIVPGDFGQQLGGTVGRTGETIGTGITNIVRGGIGSMEAGGEPFKVLKSIGQGVRGVGQALSPATTPFQGANILASFPQEGQSRLQRVGAGFMEGQTGIDLTPEIENIQNQFGFDPIKLVSSMIGFVKNPVNKALFGKTNAFQLLSPKTRALLPFGAKTLNFLATNSIRGGIEDFILSIADLPEEASTKEKLNFMRNNIIFGAAAEILFAGGAEGLQKGIKITAEKMPPELKRTLIQVFNELKAGLGKSEGFAKLKPIDIPDAEIVMREFKELISHEGALDGARVNYWKKQISTGQDIPPIKIIWEGSKWGIEDGKHRYQAYKELGSKIIPTIEMRRPSPQAGFIKPDEFAPGKLVTQIKSPEMIDRDIPGIKPERMGEIQSQLQKGILEIPSTKPFDRSISVEASPKTIARIKSSAEIAEKKTVTQEFNDWQRAVWQQEGKRTAAGAVNVITKAIKQKTKSPFSDAENMKDLTGVNAYGRDVYRNFKDVYGGKYAEIKRQLLDPFDESKGNLYKAFAGWRDRLDKEIVSKYGFKKGSKESAAIQEFGEKTQDMASLINKFGEAKAKDIASADKWFRGHYDQLLEEVNATRKKIYPNSPEKIIPRRKDYYRHFREMALGIRGLLNIFDTPANIESSLAGTSEYTKPKAKWLSFAQERLGGETEVDAVGGFINYIKAAEYAKNIDPHVASFRSLADELRAKTGKGTNQEGTLNGFIGFLDDYANDLAGKTNPADRFVQKFIGRKAMRAISWVNSRVKTNVILGNLSASIAQIFNVPQGMADVGPIHSTRGLGMTVANIFGEATPIKKSNFMIERYGDNVFDKFNKGLLKHPKNLAIWITKVLDEVGARYIWNMEYSKASAEGIKNPIKRADDLTREMTAGRGIGEVPLIHKSKMFQLIAPFQVEVGNVWHVMGDWTKEKQFGKFMSFFIISHVFNRAAQALRGSDVSLDPIQASIEAYEAYQSEEDKAVGALRATGRLTGEALSNIPLGQSVAATYPEYGIDVKGERITRKELFGEGDPTRFGSGLLVQKGLQDPLFKVVPPFGGQQLKRIVGGIEKVKEGGLTIAEKAKAVTFGPWSIKKQVAKRDKLAVLAATETLPESLEDVSTLYKASQAKISSYRERKTKIQYGVYKTESDRQKALEKLQGEVDHAIAMQKRIEKKLPREAKKFEYYSIASKTVAEKKDYVLDELSKVVKGSNDRGVMLQWLADNRKEIDGKILASQGVLKELRDMGLITSSEYKQLNDLKYNEDGSVKLDVTGRGSSAKIKKLTPVKPGMAKFVKQAVPKSKVKLAPASQLGISAPRFVGGGNIEQMKAIADRVNKQMEDIVKAKIPQQQQANYLAKLRTIR